MKRKAYLLLSTGVSLFILLLGPAVVVATEPEVPVPEWVPSGQHAQYIETYLQDEADFGTGRTRSSEDMTKYFPSAENPLPPTELADWFMLTSVDPRDRAAVRNLIREGKPLPPLVPGPDGLLRFEEDIETSGSKEPPRSLDGLQLWAMRVNLAEYGIDGVSTITSAVVRHRYGDTYGVQMKQYGTSARIAFELVRNANNTFTPTVHSFDSAGVERTKQYTAYSLTGWHYLEMRFNPDDACRMDIYLDNVRIDRSIWWTDRSNNYGQTFMECAYLAGDTINRYSSHHGEIYVHKNGTWYLQCPTYFTASQINYTGTWSPGWYFYFNPWWSDWMGTF